MAEAGSDVGRVQEWLEKNLGGATVNIGGIEAPLFFSSEGQINAQVPFELTPNTRPHVVVRTTRQDGVQTLTLPETITVAAARTSSARWLSLIATKPLARSPSNVISMGWCERMMRPPRSISARSKGAMTPCMPPASSSSANP